MPSPLRDDGSKAVHVSGQDALIVIDVQNDFTRGSMEIPGAGAVIAPINWLAPLFPNLVVATDWHPPDHVSFASARPGDTVREAGTGGAAQLLLRKAARGAGIRQVGAIAPAPFGVRRCGRSSGVAAAAYG